MCARRFFALFFAVAVAVGVPCLVRADDQVQDVGANAAVQYWQGFSLLPTLDDDQEKLLDNWQKIPIDATSEKILSAAQSSLLYLHRGSKIAKCNWGLDPNDGIGLLLPHLAKARQLGRLAGLRARSHFQRGEYDAGREDLIALLTLGRHVGQEPIMISVLVGNLIEGMAIDAAAPYVPKFKASAPKFATMYEGLPKAATVAEVIAFEKQYMAKWLLDKFKRAEQEKSTQWREIWLNVLEGSDAPKEIKEVESLAEVTRMLESLMPAYDELEKIVALPPADFATRFAGFQERSKSKPLAVILLPAVDKFMSAIHQREVKQAMLLAALRIVEQGPDAAKQTRDPFGDGPFEYKAADEGFELRSKLTHEGKQVSLTIGAMN
jgi:hypothetical protein